MTTLKPETREKLVAVSTATLRTALYKRGLRHQFIQDVRPLNPSLGNMVGEAFIPRYVPAREDLNPVSVFQDCAHPQRKAVEECPPGAVLAIDSRKDARAACDDRDGGSLPESRRDRLDGVYIGPADLTLGLTGKRYPVGFDREEPEMVEALQAILAKAHEVVIRAALHCGSPSYAAKAIGWGFDLVTLPNDVRLLASAASASVAETRKLMRD